MRESIAVLGRVVLDGRFWVERFPPVGNRTRVARFHEEIGGPAAVAALTVARLGGRSVLVGRRGDDGVGERLASMLVTSGVELDAFRAVPGGRTPVASVLITPSGERYIFPFQGEGLGEAEDARDLLPAASLDTTAAVLVDSRWPTGASWLVHEARRREVPAVVDLDVNTPEWWEVARAATHVIADEEFARDAGGVDALLDRFEDAGVWGAVTLGDRGVASRSGRIPAFELPVRDTTGAGDVFHGAFTLALTEGRGEEEALRFASAAAALRCNLADVPHREHVRRLLEGRPDDGSHDDA